MGDVTSMIRLYQPDPEFQQEQQNLMNLLVALERSGHGHNVTALNASIIRLHEMTDELDKLPYGGPDTHFFVSRGIEGFLLLLIIVIVAIQIHRCRNTNNDKPIQRRFEMVPMKPVPVVPEPLYTNTEIHSD
jgi:hypothetical protein